MNGANFYIFASREEKLSFYRKSLGVLKIDTDKPKISTSSGLRLLWERSIYRDDKDMAKKLVLLHSRLGEYADEDLTPVTPDSTYLSHVVVVPNQQDIPLPLLVKKTCTLGERISRKLFGKPGHYSVTYNSAAVRSQPDKQHIHLDFFRSRQDKRAQHRLALQNAC